MVHFIDLTRERLIKGQFKEAEVKLRELTKNNKAPQEHQQIELLSLPGPGRVCGGSCYWNPVQAVAVGEITQELWLLVKQHSHC